MSFASSDSTMRTQSFMPARQTIVFDDSLPLFTSIRRFSCETGPIRRPASEKYHLLTVSLDDSAALLIASAFISKDTLEDCDSDWTVWLQSVRNKRTRQ